jgi:hypothetical protein
MKDFNANPIDGGEKYVVGLFLGGEMGLWRCSANNSGDDWSSTPQPMARGTTTAGKDERANRIRYLE